MEDESQMTSINDCSTRLPRLNISKSIKRNAYAAL